MLVASNGHPKHTKLNFRDSGRKFPLGISYRDLLWDSLQACLGGMLVYVVSVIVYMPLSYAVERWRQMLEGVYGKAGLSGMRFLDSSTRQ